MSFCAYSNRALEELRYSAGLYSNRQEVKTPSTKVPAHLETAEPPLGSSRTLWKALDSGYEY
jgi:hypothetical protein